LLRGGLLDRIDFVGWLEIGRFRGMLGGFAHLEEVDDEEVEEVEDSFPDCCCCCCLSFATLLEVQVGKSGFLAGID